MKIITDIYRSPKKEGLYLYVEKGFDLDELPEALIANFGPPEFAMSLLLTEDKKLARADVQDVMTSIKEKGLYLQMPPVVAN